MTDSIEEWNRASQHYDLISGDPDPQLISFIRSLTDGDEFLELGAGTGRISFPLAETGARVTGVDNAPGMLAILEERNASSAVKVNGVLGDMVDPPFDSGSFDCVFAAHSSFYCLLEQSAQVTCLRNAAKLLKPNGVLLIDGFFPKAQHVYEGTSAPRQIGEDYVVINSAHGNPENQFIRMSDTILATNELPVVVNCTVRFVWPSELDLMAELAGLTLINRYGWVDKSEFNGASYFCYSVFQASNPSERKDAT